MLQLLLVTLLLEACVMLCAQGFFFFKGFFIIALKVQSFYLHKC